MPRLTRADDVPDGYAAGWAFDNPVAEMPVYLRWLTARIEELGGTVTRMALSGVPDGAEVVVNAAGLGARLFADDGAVVPVRGQVVLVEQFGLERWALDAASPTYVVPTLTSWSAARTRRAGGTYTPDDAAAKELLERAARLVPGVARAKVLGHRVGLRPARPLVRLEEVAGGVREPGRALLRPRRRRVSRSRGVRRRGRGARWGRPTDLRRGSPGFSSHPMTGIARRSLKPVLRAVEPAERVVVHHRAGDPAVLGERPGLVSYIF